MYMFHPGENYGAAAEALNLIVAPAGFELRHRQLVASVLALASTRANGAQLGFAQGQAESDLINLAREADPSVS
jgi:hypothetical protein